MAIEDAVTENAYAKYITGLPGRTTFIRGATKNARRVNRTELKRYFTGRIKLRLFLSFYRLI